jgi:hypothetical protein
MVIFTANLRYFTEITPARKGHLLQPDEPEIKHYGTILTSREGLLSTPFADTDVAK